MKLLFVLMGAMILFVLSVAGGKESLKYYRTQAAQAEAKVSLRALASAQTEYFQKNLKYADDIDELTSLAGFKEEGHFHYLFGFSGDCSNASTKVWIPKRLQNSDPSLKELQNEFTVPRNLPCTDSKFGYTLLAIGLLPDTGQLDIWSITQKDSNPILLKNGTVRPWLGDFAIGFGIFYFGGLLFLFLRKRTET
jgi:hypothetical protein